MDLTDHRRLGLPGSASARGWDVNVFASISGSGLCAGATYQHERSAGFCEAANATQTKI